MLMTVWVNAEICYEFTGGTSECPPVTPSICSGGCINHPVTGERVCDNVYLEPDYLGEWDNATPAASGYGIIGGMTVYCRFEEGCKCEALMGGTDTCANPDDPDQKGETDLPNIDINTPCPGNP
jgi:hypothetical protein